MDPHGLTPPLEGIRVVEVANYVAGPYAAALLGDMGADVIKIENPAGGDPFRGWSRDQYSPMFASVNRNKRSVTLDLQNAADRAVLWRLLEGADVFIQNFRPAVAERLGLDYPRLRAAFPRLVYCAITGFGSSGPYRDRPGYDTVGQAMSGLLSLLTDVQRPQPMGISIADHLAGLFAAYGILAALMGRARTGRGRLVDTSLLRAALSFIGENATGYLMGGEVPERATRVRMAQVFAFVAGDGLPFVVHLSSPRKFWEGLVQAVGRPDWLADPRFATVFDRRAHYDELAAALAEIFRQGPRADWLKRLTAHDVPCGPLYTLAEVFADPQVRHLGLAATLSHPVQGAIPVVAGAVAMEGVDPGAWKPPPLLGEHSQAVRTRGWGTEGAASSGERKGDGHDMDR